MSAKSYSVLTDTVTTEESSFISYGLQLTSYDKNEHIFRDISTDYESVDSLGKRFVSFDISELHFRDIIDDYIAYEADALVSHSYFSTQ